MHVYIERLQYLIFVGVVLPTILFYIRKINLKSKANSGLSDSSLGWLAPSAPCSYICLAALQGPRLMYHRQALVVVVSQNIYVIFIHYIHTYKPT